MVKYSAYRIPSKNTEFERVWSNPGKRQRIQMTSRYRNINQRIFITQSSKKEWSPSHTSWFGPTETISVVLLISFYAVNIMAICYSSHIK